MLAYIISLDIHLQDRQAIPFRFKSSFKLYGAASKNTAGTLLHDDGSNAAT